MVLYARLLHGVLQRTVGGSLAHVRPDNSSNLPTSSISARANRSSRVFLHRMTRAVSAPLVSVMAWKRPRITSTISSSGCQWRRRWMTTATIQRKAKSKPVFSRGVRDRPAPDRPHALQHFEDRISLSRIRRAGMKSAGGGRFRTYLGPSGSRGNGTLVWPETNRNRYGGK